MRRLIIRYAVATAVLVALTALAGTIWYTRYQPNRERYPVRGVDVSHHQGEIDWTAVAQDDVDFAYLKATEGADHQDDRFMTNWRAARAAGLSVGAYHYFTLCRSGAAQARNFLAAVPRQADSLPPVVDLEFGGNCEARPDIATMRRQLNAFLAPVEAREGKKAVFYVTAEFLAAYGEALPSRHLWRRSITLPPEGGDPWLFWQYHNRGKVHGVPGPVDLNVFSADRGALLRLTRAGEAPLQTGRGFSAS